MRDTVVPKHPTLYTYIVAFIIITFAILNVGVVFGQDVSSEALAELDGATEEGVAVEKDRLNVIFTKTDELISGTERIVATTNLDIDTFRFTINVPDEAGYSMSSYRGSMAPESLLLEDHALYSFGWNTREVPNGTYIIEATALRGNDSITSVLRLNVFNGEDPSTQLPWECTEASIRDEATCAVFLVVLALPEACRDADVSSKIECDELMATLFLPRECVEAEIEELNACDELLFETYGAPEECVELTADECKDILEETFVENKLFTPPEVIENIRLEKLPTDCKDEGIEDFRACEEFMNAKYLPVECTEEGILDPEECEEFVKDAFGKPKECGTLTDSACAEAMEQVKPLTVEHLAHSDTIPEECRERGLTSIIECETAMRETHMTRECKERGATTKQACDAIMGSFFGEPEACAELSELECEVFIDEVILSDFIDTDTLVRATQEVAQLADTTITLTTTDETVSATLQEVIPLAKTDEPVTLTVLAAVKEEGVQTVVPALLAFDEDGDGITDDIEERYGIDSYADLIKLDLAPVEKAIIEQKPLEQPKAHGETDSGKLKVADIAPVEGSTTTVLSGKAPPHEVVTLFIYSGMPIVVTVVADANGNFVYELDKTLVDGKHETYVVIHDEEGKIKSKSSPLAFFIDEAQAVSPETYVANVAAAATPVFVPVAVIDTTRTMNLWFILGGIAVVLFGIILLFINSALRQKRKEMVK